MRYRMLAVPAALGLSALVNAQDAVSGVRVEVAQGAFGAGAGTVAFAPQASTFQFIAAEPGMLGKPVSGAPYSGEGFTETVRTLADGTRIVNKHSKKVWRDSQGRTREEGTLPMLGPWAAQGEAPKFITITDPVAKVIYMVNEKEKTAVRRKMPDIGNMMTKMMGSTVTPDGKAGEKAMVWHTEERREVSYSSSTSSTAGTPAPKPPDHKLDVMMAAPVGGVAFARSFHTIEDGAKEEPLGTQIMEGIKVDGKRRTVTIKAGDIGNDRDLVSVTERWTSPELQVLVRMTSKDPQVGETTYKLSNLSRTEPAGSLFQVPADYTITDGPERFRIERKLESK